MVIMNWNLKKKDTERVLYVSPQGFGRFVFITGANTLQRYAKCRNSLRKSSYHPVNHTKLKQGRKQQKLKELTGHNGQ